MRGDCGGGSSVRHNGVRMSGGPRASPVRFYLPAFRCARQVSASAKVRLSTLHAGGESGLNGLGSLLVCESGSSPSRLVDLIVARGLVDRRPGATDGRAVELTLTPEGERLSREVAAIEEAMYATIDAIAGPDIGVTLDFLRAFIAGSPSSRALTRRIARSE
jgi:hypothetical protein